VIPRRDAENVTRGGILRLMGLINVEVTKAVPGRVEARLHSRGYQEARALEAPFIHWLPEGAGVGAEVVMPDASRAVGLAEAACSMLQAGEVIQFERFGFVRVDGPSPFVAYYAHS